jgi:hypothetical protein
MVLRLSSIHRLYWSNSITPIANCRTTLVSQLPKTSISLLKKTITRMLFVARLFDNFLFCFFRSYNILPLQTVLIELYRVHKRQPFDFDTNTYELYTCTLSINYHLMVRCRDAASRRRQLRNLHIVSLAQRRLCPPSNNRGTFCARLDISLSVSYM